MTTEETIRRLFATLENAVRSIAGIDATSNGLRDWFRPNHHIGHGERWNKLRELRAANNRDYVIWYAEILDDVSAMLANVNDVYELAYPNFPQVKFDGRTFEPIEATLMLLRATINWHSDDGAIGNTKTPPVRMMPKQFKPRLNYLNRATRCVNPRGRNLSKSCDTRAGRCV